MTCVKVAWIISSLIVQTSNLVLIGCSETCESDAELENPRGNLARNFYGLARQDSFVSVCTRGTFRVSYLTATRIAFATLFLGD